MNQSLMAEGPLVRVALARASEEPVWALQGEQLTCQWMPGRLAEEHQMELEVPVLGLWALVAGAYSQPLRGVGRLA
jgi:hypothetical protein